MENEIAYLKTENGLEFRLNDDKLFINSTNGGETIALRSINGIGCFDLIDQHKTALQNYNSVLVSVKVTGRMLVILGVLCLLPTIFWGWVWFLIFSLPVIGLGFFILSKLGKSKPPKMESCVRIMLNGLNRDFSYEKGGANAAEVSNFVARVEETLTSFHKRS